MNLKKYKKFHPHDILIIIGTRPELIKLAPIILKLKKKSINNFKIINTGQHKELLEKYWEAFDFKADYDLNIISPGQDLANLTIKALGGLNDFVNNLITKNEKPKFIIAQGDTTTAMAASIISFYHGISFFHVEAGLRSNDLQQPFPEEFNRKVASIVAYHHLVPTEISKKNLISENYNKTKITVVGNTVIDAIEIIRNSLSYKNLVFNDIRIREIIVNKKVVLITCHRRENQNENLQNLISSIIQLAKENSDLTFIWPVHPNPNIKEHVLSSKLSNLNNVILTGALEYIEILKLMEVCRIILTDSGGIQEEAPSFKVPVLILRDKTERPEGIKLGYSKLVGCNKDLIINSFYNFKPKFSKNNLNPYGKGNAADKIVEILITTLNKKISTFCI
jgi:UDP-N-acetylglucosamine 2-epimerase (non-hydrolysing)